MEAKCPIDYAFRRIGGKYKGRILWNLSRNEVLRYGEIRKALKDISTKMLSQTLRELENDNLIIRKSFPEVPPKVEYSLSDLGKELIPFINHLAKWGEQQMKKNEHLILEKYDYVS